MAGLRRAARPLIAALIAAGLTAACGTTVPLSEQQALSIRGGLSSGTGSALSVPTSAGSAGSGQPAGAAAGVVGGGAGTTAGASANGVTGLATGPGAGPATSSATAAASPTQVRSAGTKGPIEVGFMYSVNDAAASAGVNNNNTITLGNVVHALVTSYNSAGGFAGRRIEPVYQQLKSSSNNYSGDLASACTSFTQDHHVAAVISNLGLYSEGFLSCLAKASVPVISGDVGPDVQDAKRFPLLVTPDSLIGDTRVVEVVDRLRASGWLTPSTRIGVVVEDCPVNVRIYDNSLLPALRAAGLTLAATAEPECFRAIGDLGAISGEMANAVLSFRSRGVSRVMFVSQAQEGTMAYEFMLAAGNQDWYPGYALSSASDATILARQSGVSSQEIANSRGVGWIPSLDSNEPNQVPPSAGTHACFSRLAAQGLHPSTETDYAIAGQVCDTFAVYLAALQAVNGDASAGAVLTGVRSLGSRFSSALTLEGKTSVWDHGRLGPAEGRYFTYSAAAGGFVYTGSPFAF